MNKREAAVIGAYTGVLLGSMDDLHKYIEEVMGRPVMTHELGSNDVCNEIQEKSKAELLEICSKLT